MVVTGFLGSPRKNGNTAYLLNTMLEELKDLGADTHCINITEKTIHPCTGCALCEKRGHCHFNDDMTTELFPLLRKSNIIIIAAPVYFYTVPSELKAFIDRTQTMWARKFKLGLSDPSECSRTGFLLSVGATKGKDLFDGIHLTMKYFFRGISARYAGSLTYDRIEDPGEMKRHPTMHHDTETTAYKLISGFTSKPTILFTCKGNADRSQMAAAFARSKAGSRCNIISGGSVPAYAMNNHAIQVMIEKGIDIEFIRPEPVNPLIQRMPPDVVVSIGSGEETSFHIPDARSDYWWIPDPGNQPLEFFRVLRDEIEEKVTRLLTTIL